MKILMKIMNALSIKETGHGTENINKNKSKEHKYISPLYSLGRWYGVKQ